MAQNASPQIAIQQTLQEALTSAKTRNPSFSLRAFAQRLGVSPSSLSEILNGKRRVSRKLAERVTDRLCLPPAEREALLNLFVAENQSGETAGASKVYTQLSADQFHIVSEWYHFAIVSLAETQGFRGRAGWIARRLGIKLSEAQTALERLTRLGLLEQDARGELVPTGKQFSSPDDIQNLALRRAHTKNLELAQASLENDPVAHRDFTAVTMAVDARRLPIAKQMIREFQDRLSAFLEAGEKNEVYKISVQLFPLTQRKEVTHEGD